MIKKIDKFDGAPFLQVIGAGPAALGFFVAADRLGVLPEILNAGVVICEKVASARELNHVSLGYQIRSNSPAKDFFAGISSRGLLAPVLRSEPVRALAALKDNSAPLILASEFITVLRSHIFDLINSFPSSKLLLNKCVTSIKCADGFTTWDSSNRVISSTSKIILAAGAEQNTNYKFLDGGSAYFLADEVMRGTGFAPLMLARAERRPAPLVIIGGSHSTFAICALLLERFGSDFREGDICILHRTDVRLNYPCIESARTDKYPFSPSTDVCPETGQINRFGGLRSYAKQLYLDIKAGKERRIKLIKIGPKITSDLGRCFPNSCIIDATGYSARHIPIIDGNGAELLVERRRGEIILDKNFQLLATNGNSLPGCFGIGLGYAQTYNMIGEISHNRGVAAVNLFNGSHGETIVNAIMEKSQSREKGIAEVIN